MELMEIVMLSDLVLNWYFNNCFHCIKRQTCETLDEIMDEAMKIMKEFFNDDFELIME